MHAQFVICEQHKTSRPRRRIFLAKGFANPGGQREPAWHTQPDEHQTMMRAWSEAANVGKIEVLSSGTGSGTASQVVCGASISTHLIAANPAHEASHFEDADRR